MVAILNKCGMSAESVGEAKESFEAVLKLARKTHLAQKVQPIEPALSENVAKFIVSRLSLAVDESKLASGDGGGQKLEEESSNSLASSLASGADRGITELMTKRDMHKVAAKKSSVLTRLAFNTLVAQNGSTPSSVSAREVEVEKSDILLAVLGERGKEAVDQKRTELTSLKAQLQAGEPEHIQELRKSCDEYQSERLLIAQRIAELRQSIEKLEIYDAELCAKIVDIESEIEEDSLSRNQQNGLLAENLEQAQKVVRFGSSVGSLVDLLKIYDESLDKAVNGSEETILEAENVGEVVANKMDMFLFRVRNYFVAEAECVDFLRSRVAACHKEVGELVRYFCV